MNLRTCVPARQRQHLHVPYQICYHFLKNTKKYRRGDARQNPPEIPGSYTPPAVRPYWVLRVQFWLLIGAKWKFRPLLYKFKKSYGHTTPKLNLLVWSRPSPVVYSVSANFRQTQSCVWAKCRSMPNSQENHNFIRYTLFQKKTSKRRWAAKKCGYLKTGHSACSSIASYGRARCRAHTNVCTRIP